MTFLLRVGRNPRHQPATQSRTHGWHTSGCLRQRFAAMALAAPPPDQTLAHRLGAPERRVPVPLVSRTPDGVCAAVSPCAALPLPSATAPSPRGPDRTAPASPLQCGPRHSGLPVARRQRAQPRTHGSCILACLHRQLPQPPPHLRFSVPRRRGVWRAYGWAGDA